MVQLKVLSGKKAGVEFPFDHFPIRIGRSPGCDLCLDEPGVFDRHCEITWPSREGLFVQAQPNALVRVNEQDVQQSCLRNGDLLSLGGLRIRFELAPVRQRGLLIRELLTWIGLAGLCLGQVALIYRLLQ
jgi:pSer/pThr/pTyr-binding forkhead associated (FHA) protein